MTEYMRASDGLRLAYDDTGPTAPAGEAHAADRHGAPVVLCLAGLTRSMADFDPVVAAFSDRARLVRMDYRGRGASDYAPDPSSYTIAQEAEDALALLDHLGLARAAILGTSRGGLIAMHLAVTAPDRICGALLNDIGPEIAPEGLDAISAYLGRPPAFATLAEAAEALEAALAPAFAQVPAATWRIHAERLFRETPTGLALRYDPRLREPFLETQKAGPLSAFWPQFDALARCGPLALIRGANSNLLSADTAAKMRTRAPAMLYAEVPDRGHVPFLDEPPAQATIAAFLEELLRVS